MPRSLFPNAAAQVRYRLEQDPTVKLLNDYDWSTNPLGPIPGWPESLKGAVRLVMVASSPMVMWVGPDAILIYNDAYARFAGQRHPKIFGMPALEAWPEIADFNGINIARGLRGESYSLRDQELVLNRHGRMEPAWMDMLYSPIVGDDGLPMGCLCVVHETTDRVLTERALLRSEERLSLAISGTDMVGTWDWDVISDRVVADEQFASLFSIDSERAALGIPIAEFLRAIHEEDVQRVGDDIAQSLREGAPLRSECRLTAPDGSVTWIVATGRPRLDDNGRPVRFPGIAVDITEQKHVSEALSESELRFRTLADTIPQIVWATQMDRREDYFNARWFEFTGQPTGLSGSEAWEQALHPDDLERTLLAWQEALNARDAFQEEFRLRRHDGEYRWTLARALPMRDGTGRVVQWIGTCTDIHESRLAAEERELVAQELSHRIKNIFAVLTGIVGLSARSNPSVRPFADQLRQRIYALGEAHDFVRPHSHLSAAQSGQGALSAFVTRLMRPYDGDDGPRVVFMGEDTRIDDAAATPLALLFHELGTNAAKYGALSAPDGRVSITGADDGEFYRLTWRETGGPAVTEPEAPEGFGTRLVGLSVEGQMRGTLSRRWLPDGLEVTVSLPYDSLNRSAGLRAS